MIETYTSQVAIHTETVKISAAEDNTSKLLLDRLIQTIRRGKRQLDLGRGIEVQLVSIDTGLFLVST